MAERDRRERDPLDATIRDVLALGKNVAVVGLSDDPSRPSHDVASYLQRVGFRIFPVNPNLRTVLGVQASPTLSSIPEPIDVVDVFRRSEFVGPIVDEAIRIGARSIWLQLGVEDEDAADRARRAGLIVVMNRCLKVEHAIRR